MKLLIAFLFFVLCVALLGGCNDGEKWHYKKEVPIKQAVALTGTARQ